MKNAVGRTQMATQLWVVMYLKSTGAFVQRIVVHVVVSSGCRRWSEMTKQEAAAMLVQLYADYSTLCDKYGWPPSDGMSEAVAIAVQSLQEVE